jgi:hypothetical protein
MIMFAYEIKSSGFATSFFKGGQLKEAFSNNEKMCVHPGYSKRDA